MRTLLLSVSAAVTFAIVVRVVSVEPPASGGAEATPHAADNDLLGRLPVAFVPNLGQWEHAARYVARIGAMTMFLHDRGWTFTLMERTAVNVKETVGESAPARGVAVRMTFNGARTPTLVAEDRLPGRHHYFLGSDTAKWRSDVPLYASVRYRDMHAGIDVRAREHDGHFEYDLLLQPDGDLDSIEVAVEGIERMHIDGDGALVMETRLGPVRMPLPLSWEQGPSGEKSLITCHYVQRGEDRFGFEVSARRPDWTLVVDPGLTHSTFLGGTSSDLANALALDAQGAATVVGSTDSGDFPTTPGAFDRSYRGLRDAFVTRLSPNGSSLVYSTFLGGSSYDEALALALDAQGAATVAGRTASANFPTTPGAFDPSYKAIFVTRLSPTGSSLVYSTFLGGSSFDAANALALDAQGAATVAGYTESANFPTTPGAFDTTFNGGAYDAFVTRLSPTGSSLVYSTFLGGASQDSLTDLALDTQGAATVAGWTTSTDFPPTPGAYDTTHNGLDDAFVTRLSPTGSSLVYSTFFGGWGHDRANALAVDGQGAATVAGYTNSANLPTTPGAFDTTYNGVLDAFVTRLSPMGVNLVYSTFLGGTDNDFAYALALDAHGAASVAGNTFSYDFPTTPGAFDTTLNGIDAFVTRLDMLPTGVAAFGRSSPGCSGSLTISVNSMPRVGNAGFALSCGNAPPNTSGLCALTGTGFASPVVLLGVEIWVDPTLVFIQLPANSNGAGAVEVPLPIPNGRWLRGTRLAAQFFWAGPSSPPPCPPQGLSASNALEFTVQP